jgi:O-antigen/teichoic acid export membrane protein
VHIFNDNQSRIALVIFSTIFSLRALEVFAYELKAKSLFKEHFYASFAGYAISTVIKLIIIISVQKNVLIWLLIANLIEFLVAGFFALYYSLKSMSESVKIFALSSKTKVKSLIKLTWKQAVIASVVIIYMKIDILMIEHFMDYTSVGVYNIAVTIAELWYFIPLSIVSVIYSRLVVHYSEELLKDLTTLLIVISYIALITILLFDDMIISVFGVDYMEATRPLSILVFSGLFVSLGLVQDKWYLLKNKEPKLILKTILGLLTNILMNVFLIPVYGLNGAAVATLMGLVVSTLISDIVVGEMQIFRMKLHSLINTLVRPYGAVLIVVQFFRNN